MRWSGRGLGVLAAVCLLAACAGQPVRESPPLAGAALVAAQARQDAHEAWVREHPSWSMQGRVALSNGRDGGSGRIDWRQAGPRYDVSLSAPVTRQSWRLSGDAGTASLEGLPGGTRRGDDPARLLHEATRWEIPVTALSAWVRGARAPEALHGPAEMAFGQDGRPLRLRQDGWDITYTAWQAASPISLPSRLEARRGEALVRLVVDSWDAEAR